VESFLANVTLSLLTLTLDAAQTATATCVYAGPTAYFAYDRALLCDLVGVLAQCRARRAGFFWA
jgi:hypothetical protein